jgi:hypothetical protein
LSSECPACLRLSAGARARGPWLAGPSPEVDHIDEALCQGWSVLVRGPAHRVAHPAELRRLQEDAVVWPWPGGEGEVYVRIVPREITGRRIELRPAP